MHKSLLNIGIAAVLVLLLVCCGAAAAEHDNTYNGISWEQWTHSDKLPTEAGSYYLTGDVTLNGTWTVPAGTSETDSKITNLCLNGCVIKLADSNTGSVINIPVNTTLNLYDCDTTTPHTFRENTDGLWVLNGGGEKEHTVIGGVITGGSVIGSNGGGVYVDVGGKFTMNGGNIVGNKASGNGGGVYVNYNSDTKKGGNFTMKGDASIENNTAGSNGGGVLVTDNTATFTMMDNACIDNNTASSGFGGGGVYVSNKSDFTMEGGKITNNEAKGNIGGGGVLSISKFTMSKSAEITGNKATKNGGGVYVYAGTFNISGTPEISGNTLTGGSIPNNVYLNTNQFITVTGELKDSSTPANTAVIYINNPLTGDFATGYNKNDSNKYSVKESDASCFHSDSGALLPGVTSGLAEYDSSKLGWVVAKIGEIHNYHTVSEAITAAGSTPEGEDSALGNTITMIADSTEPTVTVGKEVTLDLAGHVLSNKDSNGSVISVSSGGNLTVKDSSTSNNKHYFTVQDDGTWKLDDNNKTGAKRLDEITDASPLPSGTIIEVTGGCITGGNATGNVGGGVYVDRGTFKMNGGNIVGNTVTTTSAGGGGVYVYGNGSTFTMKSGSIAGNTKKGGGGGGGVMINKDQGTTSSFTMENGNIVGNTAENRGGGGVDAWSGTFTMSGGNIIGNKNTASQASNDRIGCGGGVFVNAGACSFNMSNNANIAGNSAENGGGVYVTNHDNKYAVTMSGGNITGNSAENGGGVYIAEHVGGGYKEGTFTMEGGSITGNTATNGGGVFHGGIEFKVSGTPDISGNTLTGGSIPNNVYLTSGKTITVTGELNSETGVAQIKINSPVNAGLTPFAVAGTPTSGSTEYTITADDAARFAPDSGSVMAFVKTQSESPKTSLIWVASTVITLKGKETANDQKTAAVSGINTLIPASGFTAQTNTGYTFEGWGVGDELTKALIVYTGGGNIALSTDTTTFSDYVGANGWKFVGPALTLNPVFTANTYSITYDLAGGTFGTTHPTSGTYDAVFDVSAPTKEGHTFTGWTVAGTNPDYTTAKYGTSSDSVATSIAEDTKCIGTDASSSVWFKNLSTTANGSVTLTATWSTNDYTITVDPAIQHGTVTYEEVTSNSPFEKTIRITATPVTGYQLKADSIKVYKTGDPTTVVTVTNNQFTVPAFGVTITAEFEPKEYSITYDLAGGTAGTSWPTSGTYDAVFEVSAPTKEGHTFTGWTVAGTNPDYTTAKYGTSSDSVATSIAEDTKCIGTDASSSVWFKNLSTTANGSVTLIATWTVNQYTVSFDMQGHGTQIEDKKVESGSLVTEPAKPTADGYIFGGWFTEAACENAWKFSTTPVTANLNLYARWDAVITSYTIQFNGNGGTVSPSTLTVNYGESVVLSQVTAIRSGYIYTGWATTSKSKCAEYTAGQEVTGLKDGTTLYAVWTPASNLRSLIVDVKQGDNPVFGAAVTLEQGGSTVFSNPTESPAGTYTFSGVPEGAYTLVTTSDEKTVTKSVMITKGENKKTVTIPSGTVNSKVDIKPGTRTVAVDGVDDEAEKEAKEGSIVTVIVAVETKKDGSAPDVQSQIDMIKDEAKKSSSDSKLEYLGITIEKKVDDVHEKYINSTANVLEFIIPYDFTNKKDVKLYRFHEGEGVTLLEKLSEKPSAVGTKEEEGYWLDMDNGMIYFYAKQFSVYSVSYVPDDSPQPVPPSSSSRNYGASVWLPATVEPTPTPVAGETLPTPTPVKTPTQTPAPASPLPAAGILAGLGAAAVLFGFRRT